VCQRSCPIGTGLSPGPTADEQVDLSHWAPGLSLPGQKRHLHLHVKIRHLHTPSSFNLAVSECGQGQQFWPHVLIFQNGPQILRMTRCALLFCRGIRAWTNRFGDPGAGLHSCSDGGQALGSSACQRSVFFLGMRRTEDAARRFSPSRDLIVTTTRAFTLRRAHLLTHLRVEKGTTVNHTLQMGNRSPERLGFLCRVTQQLTSGVGIEPRQ
jgi:hypothetical protein